jgi:HAMP domain-containing protein
MNAIPTTELAVLMLMILLTAILTVYNHRQAAALRGVERLAQDFVAMQIRDRRRKAQDDIAGHIDPFAWLSKQINSELDGQPLTVTDAPRVVQEVQAVELHTSSGVRVIASTAGKAEIMRFDRRLRTNGKKKSAKDRVTSFASRPLLGNSRWGWGVVTLERVLSQNNEFFDLEASAVAERLGLKWDNPSRLWFYVVKR